MGKTSSAVKRRYNKKTYDNMSVSLKKGQLAFVKEIAAKHNLSVNKLMCLALEKYLFDNFHIKLSEYNPNDDTKNIYTNNK